MDKTTNAFVHCLQLNKQTSLHIAAIRALNYAFDMHDNEICIDMFDNKIKALFADCIDNNPNASKLTLTLFTNEKIHHQTDAILQTIMQMSIKNEYGQYIGDFESDILNEIIESVIDADIYRHNPTDTITVAYVNNENANCFDIILKTAGQNPTVITKIFSDDKTTQSQLREISTQLNTRNIEYNWKI